MGRPVVFSDVDGTLCFHGELNGIEELERHPNGMCAVRDPSGGEVHLSHDVSTSSYAVYLSERVRRRCHDLKAKADIILLTGGRPSTCEGRAGVLDFAKTIVAENGGIIFDEHFKRDEHWWHHLMPQRQLLAEVKAYIESYHWKLDDKGRTSGLRVRLRDNPHKDAARFARLCEAVRLPVGLRKTLNLENLDIILEGAGKEKAVNYLLETQGYRQEDSHGLGDDINDISFLEGCRWSYVLASSFPQVLQRAEEQGWMVSTAPTFAGIEEILQTIETRVS